MYCIIMRKTGPREVFFGVWRGRTVSEVEEKSFYTMNYHSVSMGRRRPFARHLTCVGVLGDRIMWEPNALSAVSKSSIILHGSLKSKEAAPRSAGRKTIDVMVHARLLADGRPRGSDVRFRGSAALVPLENVLKVFRPLRRQSGPNLAVDHPVHRKGSGTCRITQQNRPL